MARKRVVWRCPRSILVSNQVAQERRDAILNSIIQPRVRSAPIIFRVQRHRRNRRSMQHGCKNASAVVSKTAGLPADRASARCWSAHPNSIHMGRVPDARLCCGRHYLLEQEVRAPVDQLPEAGCKRERPATRPRPTELTHCPIILNETRFSTCALPVY